MLRLRPVQTLALGFAFIILIGAVLLMLPISNNNEPLSFLNSLFTAASATCVTGLAVADTRSRFHGCSHSHLSRRSQKNRS